MGCNLSAERVRPTKWKHFVPAQETKQKLLDSNSIVSDCGEDEVELIVLLDDLTIIPYLKKYISSNNLKNKAELNGLIYLWIELHNFKSMVNFHKNKFHDLMANYVKHMKIIDPQEADEVMAYSYSCANDTINAIDNGTNPVLFQRMVRNVGHMIYLRIYVQFMETDDYTSMCAALRTIYNCVTCDDFEYLGKIAKGGFGLVLQCRRKTTREVYALKVQLKAAQLRHVKRDFAKLMFEHQAYSSTHHPYVASLAYSFHNELFTFLALPMYVGGDLLKATGFCSGRRLNFDRVQFYAAEVASALMYLHCRGILYRDLKPANILLNADGHIALADFGSIADMDGRLKDTMTLDREEDSSGALGTPQRQRSLKDCSGDEFAAESDLSTSGILKKGSSIVFGIKNLDDEAPPVEEKLERSNSGIISPAQSTSGGRSRPHVNRARSLVGTLAYMAPEIVLKFGKEAKSVKQAYTDAVDWWSLGVTIYRLLSGVDPFASSSYQQVQRSLAAQLRTNTPFEIIFRNMFGTPDYTPFHILLGDDRAKDAVDIMSKLLQFNAKERLGRDLNASDAENSTTVNNKVSMEDYETLKSHPFFNGIDWEKLEKKQVSPPYIPKKDECIRASTKQSAHSPDGEVSATHSSLSKYYTFEEMLKKCKQDQWLAVMHFVASNSSAHSSSYSNNKGNAARKQNEAIEIKPRSSTFGLERITEHFPIFVNQNQNSYSHASVSTTNSNATMSNTQLGRYMVDDEMQHLFHGWHYVSPAIIDLELKAQEEERQKIQQS